MTFLCYVLVDIITSSEAKCHGQNRIKNSTDPHAEKQNPHHETVPRPITPSITPSDEPHPSIQDQ